MSRLAPLLLIGTLVAGPAFADPDPADLDALIGQAKPAWLREMDSKGAKPEPIQLALSFRPDGAIATAQIAAGEDRYKRDPNFRVVADSAVRAFLRASPLIPPNGHADFFRNNPDIIITFDPRSMR
jgi:hypothetical protein